MGYIFFNFIYHLQPVAVITQCSPHPPERGEMKEDCGGGGSMALTTQRTLSLPTQKGKNTLESWISLLLGLVDFGVSVN